MAESSVLSSLPNVCVGGSSSKPKDEATETTSTSGVTVQLHEPAAGNPTAVAPPVAEAPAVAAKAAAAMPAAEEAAAMAAPAAVEATASPSRLSTSRHESVAIDVKDAASQMCLAPERGLTPHDFSKLWHDKVTAHLEGTREWAFSEIAVWLDAPLDGPQLFWLMGGGGTGKSVLTAALHQRNFKRVVAWHYCRHDNPQASAPSSLLRSLATMLCHRLPGYADALGAVPAETVTDPKELFAALFEAPLKAVQAPEQPQLLIIDALDELPRESQKTLLSVIAGQLSQLPAWLKLFVTSREEPQIKAALSKFEPKELRANEAKNRADVEVS